MSGTLTQQHELDVFRRFVEIARIEVDLSSVIQPSPPAPDIVCKISGNDYGFELTTLTDEIIERKVGTRKSGYSNFRIDISDAVERITTKGAKRYSISRVDLVLHEGATPIDDLWICNKTELDSALQAATNDADFLRVWVVN